MKISAKSFDKKTEYARVFSRLAANTQDPREVLKRAQKTTSKNTWYVRRAAVLYIGKRLLQVSRVQQPGESAAAHKKRQEFLMHLINYFSACGCPITKENRTPRCSKRKVMSGLKPNWRLDLLNCVYEPYAKAYVVAALTGCRPAELLRGVEIAVEGDFVTFKIYGAKVTDKNGQPTRELTVDIALLDSGMKKVLLAGMRDETKGTPVHRAVATVQISCRRNFSAAILNAWRKHTEYRSIKKVTAYCLRHAFASDLKASDLSAEEIAVALGHASTSTQTCYGKSQMAKGGLGCVTEINGSRVVRSTTKLWSRSQPGPSPKRIP
jgi:integrase